MALTRRSLLLVPAAAALPAVPPLLVPPATAQERPRILVLAGTVTAQNYFRLEKALIANLDRIVRLELRFEDSEETAALVAQADAEQFVAYLRVPKTTSEIVASKGYRPEGKGYVFHGYYTIKNGGTHQGIVSIALVPADEKQVTSSKPILQRVQL